MKYVIWGAGHQGEILYKILGDEYISCFIDSKIEKQTNGFCGKKVISYEMYKRFYEDDFIIVSPGTAGDIAAQLDSDNVPYFSLYECPAEFMGYGIQLAQKYFSKLFEVVENHSAFYGLSLYSLWLYDHLKAFGKKDIAFITQQNINQNVLKKAQAEYEEIKISSIEQAKKDGRKIYVCFYDDVINDDSVSSEYFDIFDLSKNIVPYKNMRIANLKNFYAGKRCFIVATGPSLRIDDLETLRKNNEFCISMNSIFYAFDKTAWRPDIYAVLDGRGIDAWRDNILRLSAQNVPKIFLGDTCIYIDYSKLDEKYFVYHGISGRYFLDHPKMTDDFSVKTYNYATITNTCMQLAIYLGFAEIYIIGVDFNYVQGNNNHFVKDEKEHIMTQSFIKESDVRVLRGYKIVKKYADEHGIKIYNATRGGKLEVFPRVDFDSLFEENTGMSVNIYGGGVYHSRRITLIVFPYHKKRAHISRRVAAYSGSVSARSAA